MLTILISLLSSTFAAVQANADTEIVYQMALRESFADRLPQAVEAEAEDPLVCGQARSNERKPILSRAMRRR